MLLVTIGVVVWWRMPAPLNPEELRMVGRWNYMTPTEFGPRATWIAFQSDRTLFNDPILSAADPYSRVWSVADGRFSGRIRYWFSEQIQCLVDRGFTGWRDMQNDGANGRITWINNDSFQITWVNPQTNVDGLTVVMTREGALTMPAVDASTEKPAPSSR